MKHKMKKDNGSTVSYWRDPGDGSLPNPKLDAELFLGHAEEDIHPTIVRDIRGEESKYSLDANGFMAYTLPEKERCSDEPDTTEEEYFKEVSEVVKSITGAKHAVPFLKAIRQNTRDAQPARRADGSKFLSPSPRPHIDASAATARPWTIQKLPEAADLIDNATRWQILGVWRPMKTIQRDPLILSNTPTIPDGDFFDVSRDNTFGPGSDWEVTILRKGRDDKEHQWHYWSDMAPNEVLIFKHFDSDKSVPSWRCAHTSMEIPGTEQLPARESYEVRVMVAY